MDNNWQDLHPFAKLNELKKLNETFGEDFSSFDHYMNKVFSEVMSSSFFPNIKQGKQKEKKFEHHIFNLHDFVVVRMPIAENVKLTDAKIYHTSSQLTLEGIPKNGDKHTINLPSLVQHKKTKAKIKNNMLEISMMKVQDNRLTHIDLHSI
ncbi:hypothetical protein [Pueribacillus sp. YX66]|uniref:hypothetical protein n=1 Tax=Pueribacillus sp. YX66 TaxID=3229242 RepID=UPI00358D2120